MDDQQMVSVSNGRGIMRNQFYRLPTTCRWMLNTLVVFLKKDRDPTTKEFDDEEWIDTLPALLTEDGNGDWRQSAQESDVVEVGREMEVDAQTASDTVVADESSQVPMPEGAESGSGSGGDRDVPPVGPRVRANPIIFFCGSG